MNSRILGTDPAAMIAASPAVEMDGLTAFSIAELMMLEECILRCETLAEALRKGGSKLPVFTLLSECIAACRNYLAARSRDSRYSGRHGELCRDVLRATAAACREVEGDAAIRCRMACEIAQEFVEEGARNRAGMCN